MKIKKTEAVVKDNLLNIKNLTALELLEIREQVNTLYGVFWTTRSRMDIQQKINYFLLCDVAKKVALAVIHKKKALRLTIPEAGSFCLLFATQQFFRTSAHTIATLIHQKLC